MKLSTGFDLENANRSASIGGSSDDQPARRGRDQIVAVRTERDAAASQIGHLLLVEDFSSAYIDEEHGSGPIYSHCDQSPIRTECRV